MGERAWPRALVATEPWRATYQNPIHLAAGALVELTGREDVWDGHRWLWAIAPDGRAGWVPDDLVSGGRAQYTYSASELSCAAVETLTGLRATHGWIWCRSGVGAEGWVPARCLVPVA